MSVQPGIGAAYPDGGKVASFHGAPQISNDAQLLNAGVSHVYPTFACSAWETLDLFLAVITSTMTLTLNWSADAGGVVATGSTSCVVTAGQQLIENVPNLGAYCSIQVKNQTAVNGSYGAFTVVPRQGRALPALPFSALGFGQFAGNIGATSTQTINAAFVRGGRCTVAGWLSGANVTGRVFVVDGTGASRQIWGTDGIASPVRFSEPLEIPPWPVILQIQNADAAAHAANLYLSHPDRYG